MSLVNPDKLKSLKLAPALRKVNTPEWGEAKYVYVRPLSAASAGRVQEIAAANNSDGNGKAIAIPSSEARSIVAWCILGICDAKGVAMFKESDTDWLLEQPLMLLHRLVMAIFKLNDISDDAMAEKKRGSRKARSVGSRSTSR